MKKGPDAAVILIRGPLNKKRVALLTGGHTRLVDTIAGFPVREGHITVAFRNITVCDTFGLELLGALEARRNVTVDLCHAGDALKQVVRKRYRMPRRADFPRRPDRGRLTRAAQRTLRAPLHLQ